MSLNIQLLGSVQVSYDGEPITRFRSNRVRALLFYLVVEGAGQHQNREMLQELLWPGMMPKSAQGNLRQTLYELRKLGAQWEPDIPLLLSQPGVVRLNPDFPLASDVHEFERLRHGSEATQEEAVRLYRGAFLADFYLPDANPFEEWVASKRGYYQREVLAQLASMTEQKLGTAEYTVAEWYARRQLEIDQLLEGAHRQLMMILSRTGRRSEALRQYERCRDLLARELRVEPSNETELVQKQIASDQLAANMTAHGVVSERTSHNGLDSSGHKTIPNNLPQQLTAFIGRQSELNDLVGVLADPTARLVTIVGTGGMGKTRLAQALAEHILERADSLLMRRFPDGIFFVELAPLTDAENVAGAILDAMHASTTAQSSRTPAEELQRKLQHKMVLLILDNFEHLLDATSLVAEMLRASKGLHIITTSRVRLRLQAERLFRLDGLQIPEWETTADALANTSVQLFLAAASRSDPTFELADTRELKLLARICRLVAGMPLALEMAAGWIDVLSLEEIAAELAAGLDILETETRDIPERHQSVRAVLEYSWRHLNESEQEHFAAISVFRGGFSRDAAKIVCGVNFRELSRLADKSLLRFDKMSRRYRIHELLRQFGAEQLETSSRMSTIQAKHSKYFLTFMVERQSLLVGSAQTQAIRSIKADIENVRMAFFHALKLGDSERLGKAIDSLWLYFEVNSYQLRANLLRSQLLSHLEEIQDGKLLEIYYRLVVSHMMPRQEDIPLYQEALEYYQRQGDDRMVAKVIADLGFIHLITTDPDNGLSLIKRGIALARDLGEESKVQIRKVQLASAYSAVGQPERALALLDESISYFRSLGDKMMCQYGYFIAPAICWQLGYWNKQRRYIEEVIPLTRDVEQPQWGVWIKTHLVPHEILTGRLDAAASILEEAAIQLTGEDDVHFDIEDKRGLLAIAKGQYARGQALLSHSRERWQTRRRRLDAARAFSYYWGISIAQFGLGDYGACYRELLQGLQRGLKEGEIGNLRLYLPVAALLLQEKGHSERSTELFSLAASSLSGWTGWLESWDLFTNLRAELEANCGQEAFATAWATGQKLELEPVVESVLGELRSLTWG